jgi:plastocyanin
MAANQFQPTTATVGVGGEVTWTNTDTIPHTVTADDGSFDSGIMMPGDTFTWRFDQAGSVPYRCILHPGMIGAVDVVAASEGSEGAAPAVPSPASTAGEPADEGSTALSSSGTATDEIVVQITDGEFPAVVTLAVGQTITWVNDHERPIDVVADDGSFNSGEIAPGGRFSRTLLAEGALSYRSTLRDRTESMLVVLPGSAEAGEVVPTVAVYDAWFAPRDLVVHQGSTVRWAFGGVLPHTVTLADGSFDSGILQPGEIVEVTFGELGTFDYSCIVHPSMTGTVTVVPPGEEIPESQSGISALGGGGDAAPDDRIGAAADQAGSSSIPLGAIPLMILGLGFGAAFGILFGVGRSAPRRVTAGAG